MRIRTGMVVEGAAHTGDLSVPGRAPKRYCSDARSSAVQARGRPVAGSSLSLPSVSRWADTDVNSLRIGTIPSRSSLCDCCWVNIWLILLVMRPESKSGRQLLMYGIHRHDRRICLSG